MNALNNAINIEDLRRIAKWRLPKAIFDFVDGGAEDEWTRRRNRTAFERYTFRPRVLVDVSKRDLSTTVFGHRIDVPIIIAPTGLPGMAWPKGELLAVRAATKLGTIFSLSTYGSSSIEEVAAAGPGPFWFQLYVSKDREFTNSLIDRAAAAGFQAMAITVDTQVSSKRERDIRNGYSAPPRVTLANVVDVAWRVGWLKRFIQGPRPAYANLSGKAATLPREFVEMGQLLNRQNDSSVNWADLDGFRARWKGPLLLKGVVNATDARIALDHGVDGILVSNHGGRQLDGAPASIEVLPEIVDAVGDKAEVYLDSGVRRGSDIVKAIALGARAVLIGRPYIYGLAAGGEAGVEKALSFLKDELDRCLALNGVPNVRDLDRSIVRYSGNAFD